MHVSRREMAALFIPSIPSAVPSSATTSELCGIPAAEEKRMKSRMKPNPLTGTLSRIHSVYVDVEWIAR